jgi:hypothetical protein
MLLDEEERFRGGRAVCFEQVADTAMLNSALS